MTNNITFPLTDEMIETLFNEGKCLTFHWWYRKNLNIHPTPEQYKKYHGFTKASHSAIFATENNRFHYFDNGILLCSIFASPLLISRFENLIKSKGFPITRKYLGMLYEDEKKIENYAVSHYDTSDAYMLPNIENNEQIDTLFANGNVCLTASKNEAFSPEYRKHFAVFTDGQVIYNFDKNMRYIQIDDLIRDYPDYVYLSKNYTRSDTLEKIYQKASEYSWYSSPEEAEKLYQKKHPTPSLTAEEQARIAELIKDNHCLTVDEGRISFDKHYDGCYPIDKYNYALFANGRLIISTRKEHTQKKLIEDLTLLYPNMELKPEVQSEQFVIELYKALLKTQPSARDCYGELLKENARKLKSLLKISHMQALDLCAQLHNWQNWHNVTTINEKQARYMIRLEKKYRYQAQQNNLNYLNCLMIEHLRRISTSKEDFLKNLAKYEISEKEYHDYMQHPLI